MCVQGRFCLQRKPRQANPQPFPYPLTGGLGLIKLLSKTRRDEFPSFHLPCRPFNSAEIRSFLFSYVKTGKGGACIEGDRQGREREGEEEEQEVRGQSCQGAASQAQTKQPDQRKWEVTGKGQAAGQLLAFSGWDLLCGFYCLFL